MKFSDLDRRSFIKAGGIAALTGAACLAMPRTAKAFGKKKAKVVLIRDKAAVDSLNRSDKKIVPRMLDDAVSALFESQDAQTAWNRLVGPDDTVGIKTNVWKYIRTPEVLEESVRGHCIEAGVKPEKIAIDDRGVLGNDGFRDATVLINMRPMRTHHWSGLGTLIKNYIMFVPSPWEYHDDSCADLASIWKLPNVVGRTRLNVLVMLTPMFHGSGPHHFNPKYVWRYNGLLVGTDPVAVDSVGARIIEAKRRDYFDEERPINPSPKHIQLAQTRHGLGIADPDRIEITRLGWKEDILI